MDTQNGEVARHDTARAAGLIGNGISRQVIRRWARNDRFHGSYQREPNAKLWLTDQGVLEVWALWAEFKDLDFEKDMPAGVRRLRDRMPKATEASAERPSDQRLSVTIILPPGANLQVVQQG
jgi:hypothetical protein